MFIAEGDDEVEFLVVGFNLDQCKVRFISAYEPQMSDSAERKDKFWTSLQHQVRDAELNEAAIIIEMDGNFHAGDKMIPGDPNPKNLNGKRFENE